MANSIKLLLIEENPELQKKYSDIFANIGCTVYEAASAEHALNSLETIHPEIVILCSVESKLNINYVLRTMRYKVKKIKLVIISENKINEDISAQVDYVQTTPLDQTNAKQIIKKLFNINLYQRKIFLVDDSSTTINVLKRLLEIRGYIVGFANTGKDALEEMPKFKPNVVTLDYELPDTNGVDLSKKIREVESLKKIPIFMLTTSESKSIKKAAFEAGIFDYFLKKDSSMIFVEYLDNYFKIREAFTESATVLIVEDSKTVCEVIRNYVSSAGLDPVFVHTAEEGLDYVSNNGKMDIILCDINLPKMNGLELIRIIRKLGYTNIPIIAMTSNLKEITLVRSFLYGANDYIQKPFQRDELVIRLQSLIKIKNLQQEIIEKNKYLEQLNQTKSLFLGMAAHDLRTPLTTIRNGGELLSASLCDKKANRLEVSGMILEESNKMIKLLDDLLSIHKIEEGHFSIEATEVNLYEFLPHIVKTFELTAEKKKIKIILENNLSKKAFYLDKTKVNQVIDNFISNAIKYSEEGTEVTIKANLENSKDLKIEVIDQGQGIAETELPQVFKQYGNLSSKPTAGEGSVGLGLSICKTIIDALGGKIGVKSQKGKGSTFYFTLPNVVVD